VRALEGPPIDHGWQKRFVFEKKNQRTFASGVRLAGYTRDSDIKVFYFVSSKKKTFLPKSPS
jgi:hypothetical protein